MGEIRADVCITVTHHYVLSVGLRMLPSAELGRSVHFTSYAGGGADGIQGGPFGNR